MNTKCLSLMNSKYLYFKFVISVAFKFRMALSLQYSFLGIYYAFIFILPLIQMITVILFTLASGWPWLSSFYFVLRFINLLLVSHAFPHLSHLKLNKFLPLKHSSKALPAATPPQKLLAGLLTFKVISFVVL